MVDVELALYKKEMSGIRDVFGSKIGDGTYGSSEALSQDTSSLAEDLVVTVADGDRMLLRQEAAHDPVMYEKLQLLEEIEAYLAAYEKAEKALNDTIPPFGEMVDRWVDDALTVSAGDELATDIERAEAYRALLTELRDEYQEYIDAGSIEALAEWDAVEKIVDLRVAKFTQKYMLATLKVELGLAA